MMLPDEILTALRIRLANQVPLDEVVVRIDSDSPLPETCRRLISVHVVQRTPDGWRFKVVDESFDFQSDIDVYTCRVGLGVDGVNLVLDHDYSDSFL